MVLGVWWRSWGGGVVGVRAIACGGRAIIAVACWWVEPRQPGSTAAQVALCGVVALGLVSVDAAIASRRSVYGVGGCGERR